MVPGETSSNRVGTVPGALDQAAAGQGVVPLFQRVVSLSTGAVVGYEALARWPSLSDAQPLAVFARARRNGTLDALDHACINAAAHHALEGASTPGMLLLINCEPTTADLDLGVATSVAKAAETFQLVFELTERGLLTNPRALLRKVANLRDLGFSIALDDIGVHSDSLALLDVVAPELLKLDLGLIQNQPNRLQARTVAAVLAHHERTGATILAEGIETEEHLEQALAYGAALGQGYRFGYPGGLTTPPDGTYATTNTVHHPLAGRSSVFELAAQRMPTRTVRKHTMLQLSRHIERLASAAESPPMVLAALQEEKNFSGVTADTYRGLAVRSPLVVVLASGIPASPCPGVRGVHLEPGDPVLREWVVLVLGPDIAAGLIAREHRRLGGGDGLERDERFDMVMTFDRDLVTAAARGMLERIPAVSDAVDAGA